MIGREDEVRAYRDRIFIVQTIVVIMLGFIFVRLFFLQIIKGDELRKFSEANRLKKEKLFPPRGIIFDRNGKVIVDNRASFDVVLHSQYYPFDEVTTERLAVALDMPLQVLQKRLSKVNRTPSFYPLLLKSDVSKEIIAAIEMDAEGFPGVDIEAVVQRRYPFGDVAAQLLGYVGEVDPNDIKSDPKKVLTAGDYIGKMGIERMYDGSLRGVNGAGYVEVDARGRRRKTEGAEKLLGFFAQTDPTPGDNLYLTIDADLEAVAATSMRAKKFNGSVVALDPRNGEILALLNLPSYDPGLISGREVHPKVWSELRNSRDRPLRNRAIQDHYPPGSAFKLMLAISGLAENQINLNQTVNCPGHMQFGNRRFHCWKKHGVVDFMRAVKESCDVYFYTLGNRLGVDMIAKYARLMGFGAPTGIKISGEQRGLIPDTEWKKKVMHDQWHPGETLSVAIGQGLVDATPIQLAVAYSAIGNGGFVYRPHVMRSIDRNGEVKKEFHPELIRKVELPPGVLETVRDALSRVVNEPGGTAYSARSKKLPIAGKTGTAQVRAFADMSKVKSCDALPYYDRHHAWFVGFAPVHNPQIAVVTLIEHGCHSYDAAQVVRDVVDAYFDKYKDSNPIFAEYQKKLEPKTPSTEKTVREPAAQP